MSSPSEPAWLVRLRVNAKQRPRTQFVKVRWHDLQQVLGQRDLLLERADEHTKADLDKLAEQDYGRP